MACELDGEKSAIVLEFPGRLNRVAFMLCGPLYIASLTAALLGDVLAKKSSPKCAFVLLLDVKYVGQLGPSLSP
jgi:hypothetical protein